MSEQAKAAPGWYPRPDMPGTQGYWDGAKWSERVAPLPPPNTPAATNGGLEVSGWVFAVLFPVIGFVIGIVLLAKGSSKGAWIMALSLVVFFAAYRAITSSADGY